MLRTGADTLDGTRLYVAGVCAGLMEAVTTNPLETIKVRMQNAQLAAGRAGVSSVTSLSVATGVFREGGALGFYRGCGPRVLNSAVGASVLFGVNGELKHSFGAKGLDWRFKAAAFCTGVVEAIVYTPLDLVRTIQQGKAGESSLAVARRLYREGGFGQRGLYKGFSGMLPKESLGNVSYFTAYEVSRSMLGRERAASSAGLGDMLDSLKIMLAGGNAGIMYTLVTHPIDTVKVILQSETGPSKFRGALDCAAHVYRRSGWAGLYAGLWPNLMRAYVANSVTFLTLEICLARIDAFTAAHGSRR